MVDAANGVVVGASLDDARSVQPHPWRPKSEPLAWRQYVFGESTTDPQEDFDRSGCEVPPCNEEALENIDQLTLFDNGFQPDPPKVNPCSGPRPESKSFPTTISFKTHPTRNFDYPGHAAS